MTKREMLDDPNSCLNKAADDEPIFVLRAKDLIAPAVVGYWQTLAGQIGSPFDKLIGAGNTASDMLAWRARGNAPKIPD
jgi:hypothetical protein